MPRHTPRRDGYKFGFKDWIGQNERIIHLADCKDYLGLIEYVEMTKGEFNDVNWATVFTKLAGMFSRRESVVVKRNEAFGRIRADFERRLEDEGMGWLGMQAITNILRAYGVLRIRSEVVYKCLSDDASRIVEKGDPRHISDCVYAIARLGYEGEKFVEAVENENAAKCIVTEGNPQEISNTAWALATLAKSAPNFAHAVDRPEVVRYLMQEGASRHLSCIMWSMATLGHRMPNLARSMDTLRGVKELRRGETRDVVNAFWAMVELGHEPKRLGRAMEGEYIMNKISKEGKMQDFSKAIWAMSKLRYECPRLVRLLEERAEALIRTGTSREISDTASGLATIGCFSEVIFDNIGANHGVVTATGDSNEIYNTLWAFGISGTVESNEVAVRNLWEEIVKRPVWEFTNEQWRQVEIVRLHAKAEGVHLEPLEDEESALRLGMIEIASKEQIKDGSETFVNSIVEDLGRFGFKRFERGVGLFDDGEEESDVVKMDVAWRKEKIGLQLEGPSNFLRAINETKGVKTANVSRDGPSKARKRLLEAFGWKVLRLSHFKKMKYDKLDIEEKHMMWVLELGKLGVEPDAV